MASNQKTLLLWLAGGAGVVLIYAAIKNISPKKIVLDGLSGSTIYATDKTPVANMSSSDAGNTSAAPVLTSATLPALPDAGAPYVYDANGYMVQVPSVYGTGATYIPPVLV